MPTAKGSYRKLSLYIKTGMVRLGAEATSKIAKLVSRMEDLG